MAKFKHRYKYRHDRENDELAERSASALDPEDKARRARAYMRIRRQQERDRQIHKEYFLQRKKEED